MKYNFKGGTVEVSECATRIRYDEFNFCQRVNNLLKKNYFIWDKYGNTWVKHSPITEKEAISLCKAIEDIFKGGFMKIVFQRTVNGDIVTCYEGEQVMEFIYDRFGMTKLDEDYYTTDEKISEQLSKAFGWDKEETLKELQKAQDRYFGT